MAAPFAAPAFDLIFTFAKSLTSCKAIRREGRHVMPKENIPEFDPRLDIVDPFRPDDRGTFFITAVFPAMATARTHARRAWYSALAAKDDLAKMEGPEKKNRNDQAILGMDNSLSRLWDALASPALRGTDDEWWNYFYAAILWYGYDGSDGREEEFVGQLVDEIEAYLDIGLDAVIERSRALSLETLGPWGAFFFQRISEDEWDNFDAEHYCKSVATPGYHPIELAPPEAECPEFWRPDLGTLTMNEGDFSVRVAQRKPVVLGCSDQYRLMKALVERKGRAVPFAELNRAMGRDQLDTLHYVKSRLTKTLSKGGLHSLAKAISAEDGHYGLMVTEP